MAGNAFLNYVSGVITMVRGVQVGGAGNANAIPALNASGQFDITMMPTGVGANTQVVTASEAITAGSLVNIWSNSGAFAARNADATAPGKTAYGFVLSAVSSGGSATVYLGGNDNAVTGLVPGPVWLGTTGGYTQTAPSTAGAVSQMVGVATSSTNIDFQPGPAITLA